MDLKNNFFDFGNFKIIPWSIKLISKKKISILTLTLTVKRVYALAKIRPFGSSVEQSGTAFLEFFCLFLKLILKKVFDPFSSNSNQSKLGTSGASFQPPIFSLQTIGNSP